MQRLALVLALSLPQLALAAPPTMQHQGRMFDALGAPIAGTESVTFAIYDTAAGGTALWSENHPSLNFDNGYFAATLGSTSPMDDAAFEEDDLWLGITVGTSPELTRMKLNSVPYAMRAGGVEGGTVNASEIMVNGTTIVDSSGNLVSDVDFSNLTNLPTGLSDGDDDTLASLTCNNGDIAQFASGAWSCVASTSLTIGAGQINGTIPASSLPVGVGSTDVAAGDASYLKSETYTRTEIDNLVGNAVGPGLGLVQNGSDLDISEYAGGPLIPNSRFESGDLTGWTVTSGSGAVASVSDGQAGSYVFANDPLTSVWVGSNARIAVRPAQDYTVSGSFRRTEAVGNAGTFYLAVRLFDAGGAEITGDGTWWYYPVQGAELTDTTWHRYTINFGPSFGRALPPEAATMSVGAILNYNGGSNGNRSYEVTNLQLATALADDTVAWSASDTTGDWITCNSNNNGRMVMNNVDLNVGGAYDPTDGFITAPVGGVYELCLAFLHGAASDDYVNLRLEVNGSHANNGGQDHFLYDTIDTGNWRFMTACQQVWLNPGDRARIQPYGCTGVYEDPDNNHERFWGHRL